MILVIFLFFIIPGNIFSQCREQFVLSQTVSLEGKKNSLDNYYQNLIIQDIAIANQQTFNEISLRLDYTIRYVADQCTPSLLNIRVQPVEMKCFPLFYYGFDIAGAIKPEKADLVFYLIRHDGYVSDSIIFFDIPLEKDSSLYSSLTAEKDSNDRKLTVTFTRAVFHYTKSSYEVFRDRILQIDDYYAAAMLADSALVWASNGILAETGNKAEIILRQVEIERIISYIRPEKFKSVFIDKTHDLNGLIPKYGDLVRLNNRMKAIIHYNRFNSATLSRVINKKDLVKNYLDRFDHYHQLAFKTDFRFVNFIDGLSVPRFSNASLFAIQQAFNKHPDIHHQFDRRWCSFVAEALINRGSIFELAGNQPRALTYYESAYRLSQLMNLPEYQSKTFHLVGLMKKSIASSYLEISRKSALTENPAMAVQYFHEAMELFNDNHFIKFETDELHDYEEWLFLNFENQAVKYIGLKNYSKALVFLNEIKNHCNSSSSYPCPDLLAEWMGTVRAGMYHNLLLQAKSLLVADESQEAEQVFRQATDMRMRAGYRVEKDQLEGELESRFLQINYDETVEEGLTNFAKEEFSDALYYFNKADFQERSNVLRPFPELFHYRQAAARHILEAVLAEGRLKAWAFDFERANELLGQIKMMLPEYQFSEADTLTRQYIALDSSIHQNQCEKVFREYNGLMLRVNDAKQNNEFIIALKLAIDAVNLSMDHLNCRIRDDDAWYQKIILELPADFQKKEKELETLLTGPNSDYLKAFQDLKTFYYRHKLLEQGVIFIPLYERVIKATDSLFLTGMLDYYIKLKAFDKAWTIMERIHELGYSAEQLADEQKSVGAAFARRDALNPESAEPWELLDAYIHRDKWFREFTRSYKRTWLQTTKWKLKYWPLIWKK